MPIPVPYVSRSEAETFIHLVNQALKQPGDNPVLLHLYGIGGVGKTTLTRKIEKEFSAKATFLRIALGEKIEDPDTPLEIMETLHDTLPKENAWTRDLLAPKDPFVPLMEQYKTTRHQIETQPPQGSGSVDSAKIGQVKQVLRVGVDLSEWLGLSKPLAEAGRVISDKGVDMVTAGLTLKDEVVQHIQAHQAVQKNRKLKELMLKPVAQLSEAFVQELCQRVKQQPVVLVFDTYEKAPKEVDRWLRRILLDNPQLQQAGVRMIVAGRHRLTTTDEGWRKLQQDYGYLAEQPIERFSPEQTENYMQQAQLEALGTLEDIWAITKGLPYYLNWLREERQQGKSPNLAEGNREIERLLLQGQGDAARQMVYLAACCRWFDRSLIQYLVGQFQLEPPPDSSPDGETDWFDWLIRRTFVVPVATVYRLDDVARDVFRLSCVRNQPELFQQAHDRLARRFKALSDQEVSSRRPVEEKYKNQSWRRYRSEYLYYLIFSRHSNLQQVFRTHLLESRYFEMDALIKDPFRSVLEDVELNEQLAFGTKQFLETIRPAVEYGWTVLEEFSIDYKQLQIDYDLSRDAIDDAIEICLNPIDSLTGLAKLMALLCKAKRCQANDVLKWLKMAATEAETFVDVETSEFCADLFNFQLGLGFYSLGYPEQALAHFDRSIEFNPGKDAAWSNRGNSLDNLGRYQEAIASYDKAIEVKPDKHAAWSNRGISLANLGQHQEAIASYDKAIEFKPNLHEAWYDRGLSLSKLNRYQEAIASYDKAIEVNPDLYKAWYD
ncbi:MAG: tetratricopeptide repeat protein, partial [Cyanobacteria bacterium P01_F01_bin.150]